MYQVFISKTAEKQLKKLPHDDQRKVAAVIASLKIDPLPYGTRKLTGSTSTYRLRVGLYRIIYDIEKKIVTLTVLKIGHRKSIYR